MFDQMDHKVILQVLDRANNGWDMPSSSFEGTESLWDQVPLIFSDAGKHPDPLLFEKNPEKAMADIGARRINGRLKGTVVVHEGQPRLESTIDFFHEPELEKLIEYGILKVSTGWFAQVKEKKGDINIPLGKVQPQHVLLFPVGTPGDGGAFILNSKPNPPVRLKLAYAIYREWCSKVKMRPGPMEFFMEDPHQRLSVLMTISDSKIKNEINEILTDMESRGLSLNSEPSKPRSRLTIGTFNPKTGKWEC